MRLLDRYIARQVFVSAVYAVVVIIILLVLGNVFKEILRELAKRPDISLGFVMKFVLLIVPIALSLAVPFSFLTAILLVFGRLSADSEFVSMRMAGLSMWRISAPVGALAVFFTGICAYVNLSVTPWAKTEMEGLKASLFNMLQRDPLMIFPDQQVMDELPDHLVFARKEDGVLHGLHLVRMEDFVPQAIVVARTAKVSVDLESEHPEMVLDMADVNVMAEGEGGDLMRASQPVFLESAPFGVPLDEFKEVADRVKESPGNISLGRLFQRAGDTSQAPSLRAAYRTELSMRFAFSVSCLTFALIGVPLGITSQRRESTAGFVLSMVIAVAYFAMLNVAKMMKWREEMHPHLLVWVPNILFLGLGFYLFWRLGRK